MKFHVKFHPKFMKFSRFKLLLVLHVIGAYTHRPRGIFILPKSKVASIWAKFVRLDDRENKCLVPGSTWLSRANATDYWVIGSRTQRRQQT